MRSVSGETGLPAMVLCEVGPCFGRERNEIVSAATTCHDLGNLPAVTQHVRKVDNGWHSATAEDTGYQAVPHGVLSPVGLWQFGHIQPFECIYITWAALTRIHILGSPWVAPIITNIFAFVTI
jgi:hypothetical protein